MTTPPPLSYATPDPGRNSRTMVQVLGILLLSTAGVSALSSLGYGALFAFILFFSHSTGTATTSMSPSIYTTGPATSSVAVSVGSGSSSFAPEYWYFYVMGIALVLNILGLLIEAFAGIRLLRRGHNAQRWGMRASILCAVSIWSIYSGCCLVFFLNLGIGIYGIIILQRTDVRAFLNAAPFAFEPQMDAPQ